MRIHLIKSLALSLVLVASAAAASLVNTSGASNIALNGYDPVAFFTQSQPVHGSPSISVEHDGATFLFSTEDHKKMFAKNPAKYAPQCGGFCAYGVGVGALFPVDINTWQIKDGKLYLNLNPEILEAFNGDLDGNIKKAKQGWPKMVKQHGN